MKIMRPRNYRPPQDQGKSSSEKIAVRHPHLSLEESITLTPNLSPYIVDLNVLSYLYRALIRKKPNLQLQQAGNFAGSSRLRASRYLIFFRLATAPDRSMYTVETCGAVILTISTGSAAVFVAICFHPCLGFKRQPHTLTQKPFAICYPKIPSTQ